MNAKLAVLGTILGLQTAWILGTTAVQERGLATGQIVLLETQPVDPRDYLRGDYVILNYKISRLPGAIFTPPLAERLPVGQTVYVVLEPRGDFYEARSASMQPMEATGTSVVLKGVADRNWTTNEVQVSYGLERYYVAEGTGNPTGKLTVRAAVPKSGNAQIKEVLLDGKPYAEVMRQAVRR
jgi:uncharacterized membrane-anchored protein